MKRKNILAFVLTLIIIFAIAGCANTNGAANGSKPVQPSSSEDLSAGEESPLAIDGPGGVVAEPSPKGASDGTIAFGELRVRSENGQFEFSADKGATWSSDWEDGLPDGYSYIIEGDTLEVDNDNDNESVVITK